MPDNPTYVDGDGKYHTFEDIPTETSSSSTRKRSIVDGKSKARRKECTRSLGLLLAFLSGVMMTTYSSLIKTLEEMDVMQVVVIRGVLQVSIMGGDLKSDQTNKT